LQEIGAPTPWVSGEDAAGFADTSIRSALRHPAVEAVTWWCSHDVSRELADFPEVEYTLGLFDEHGAVKPIGEAISQIARERPARATPRICTPSTTAPAPSSAAEAPDRTSSPSEEFPCMTTVPPVRTGSAGSSASSCRPAATWPPRR